MPDVRWPKEWVEYRGPKGGFGYRFVAPRGHTSMRLTEMPVLVPVDEHGEPDIDGLIARLGTDPAEVERMRGALNISPDDVGRIMHESWSRTKRSQGFHHPSECPNGRWVETARGRAPCPKCHADLIPWDNLPDPQKDINRHAFDDVLAEIRRRAALAERGGEDADDA